MVILVCSKRAVKFAGKTAGVVETRQHDSVDADELQGPRAADMEVRKDRAREADKGLEEEIRRPTGRRQEGAGLRR